mmetsp:Transcript_80619/g.224339  ORF Transcript_80619/g.224339 Transcript_80619/m.224339 type:complete len:345 (+) Transcript_80619:49-1083(+)
MSHPAARHAHVVAGGVAAPAGSMATFAGPEPAGDTMSLRRERPPMPRSHRGLVDGIGTAENGVERCAAELDESRAEAAALRSGFEAAVAFGRESAVAQASLEAEIRTSRKETAELWAFHEVPMREQEEALQRSAETARALESVADACKTSVASLRSECSELRGLGERHRHETEEIRSGHATYVVHVERASERTQFLSAKRDQGESALEAARHSAATHKQRRNHLEAEVVAEKAEVRSLRQELSDLERLCRTSISGWWAQQQETCQALAAENEVLQREFRQQEVALEGPSQEAAAWREQAYRSESALRTMLGEDVAGGLRALNKSCERHVQLDVGNSVEAVPSTC